MPGGRSEVRITPTFEEWQFLRDMMSVSDHDISDLYSELYRNNKNSYYKELLSHNNIYEEIKRLRGIVRKVENC